MEFAILDFLQTIHNPVLDAVMCALSAAGNGGLLWILLGIVLLFWKRTRKEGIIVLLILLGCLIVGNLILKNAVATTKALLAESGGGAFNPGARGLFLPVGTYDGRLFRFLLPLA